MKRRGATLFQLLAGLVISGIVGAAIFSIFLTIDNNQRVTVDLPTAQQRATEMAKEVAGAFRRAELCTSSDTGCTINAAFENGLANSVTVYSRDSSGTLVKVSYDVVGGAFRRTVGASTKSIYPNGTTMSITYYQGSGYHDDTLATYTPTTATAPALIGVRIETEATVDGRTARYATVVRTRNGPKKISPVEE